MTDQERVELINTGIGENIYYALIFYTMNRNNQELSKVLYQLSPRARFRAMQLAKRQAISNLSKPFGNEVGIWAINFIRDARKRQII